MNVSIISGNITRDIEVRYSASGTAVAKFSVAVNRNDKDRNVDFINCLAFGKTAEFIEKYFGKGSGIGIVGKIQTGSYTNNEGKKVYTTDIVVDKAEFVGSKGGNGTKSTDFDVPEGFSQLSEDLPF